MAQGFHKQFQRKSNVVANAKRKNTPSKPIGDNFTRGIILKATGKLTRVIEADAARKAGRMDKMEVVKIDQDLSNRLFNKNKKGKKSR